MPDNTRKGRFALWVLLVASSLIALLSFFQCVHFTLRVLWSVVDWIICLLTLFAPALSCTLGVWAAFAYLRNGVCRWEKWFLVGIVGVWLPVLPLADAYGGMDFMNPYFACWGASLVTVELCLECWKIGRSPVCNLDSYIRLGLAAFVAGLRWSIWAVNAIIRGFWLPALLCALLGALGWYTLYWCHCAVKHPGHNNATRRRSRIIAGLWSLATLSTIVLPDSPAGFLSCLISIWACFYFTVTISIRSEKLSGEPCQEHNDSDGEKNVLLLWMWHTICSVLGLLTLIYMSFFNFDNDEKKFGIAEAFCMAAVLVATVAGLCSMYFNFHHHQGRKMEAVMLVVVLTMWILQLPVVTRMKNSIAVDDGGWVKSMDLYFGSWGAFFIAYRVASFRLARWFPCCFAADRIAWMTTVLLSWATLLASIELKNFVDCSGEVDDKDQRKQCSFVSTVLLLGSAMAILSTVAFFYYPKLGPRGQQVLHVLVCTSFLISFLWVTLNEEFHFSPFLGLPNLYFCLFGGVWFSLYSFASRVPIPNDKGEVEEEGRSNDKVGVYVAVPLIPIIT